MKQFLFAVLVFTVCLTSCDRDSQEIDKMSQIQTKNSTPVDTVKVSGELSLALGRALTNRASRNNVVALSQSLDTFGDAVSIAAMLEVKNNILPFEERRLNELNSDLPTLIGRNYFKDQLLHVIRMSSIDYPTLMGHIKTTDSDETIIAFLASLKLEIAIPYAENFDWDNISSFITTYEDFSEDDLHTATEFDEVDSPLLCQCASPTSRQLLNLGDDDFYTIPTFGVTMAEMRYKDVETWDPTGGDVPPPLENNRVLLGYNINPLDLPAPEKHIITTNIPRIRVTDRNWKRTLSRALRMEIKRASADAALTPSGTYTAVAKIFTYSVEIPRHTLKHARWVNVNWQWDPNWTPIEGSQQIIVYTLHKNAGNPSFNVTTKLNLNAQGVYTPESNLTVSYSGNVTESKLRGNRELDRNQVLTTIIDGSESGNPIHTFNGINYSIRKVDAFEYFFEHYYTSLE